MIVEKRTELVDNDDDNFTNGALQEVSSDAEQMISEEQDSVQETHRECHLSNDELPNMIVEKRTELVDNDHGNFTNGALQEVSSGAERMISEVQEPVQETHRECHFSNDELPTKIEEKRTELVDNDDGNFTNGALQEVSFSAEHMISEVQEPVQETHGECHLSNDELPNMIVEKKTESVDNDHGNFTNGAPQVVSSDAEHMISEEQEPVQETQRECHLSNDGLPNMIVEKRMELIDNVFSLREKNILCKQQLEISGLDTYTQNKVMRLKEVCNLILEHIRRSHIDEMTRSDKIKLTVQWFTMLMYAFLEHMRLQHNKLKALQSGTWSVERHLKENLHKVAKSGQLDQDFDRHIALPDSNFVMEEFIHFKEQNDEYRIVESSVSDNQQPLDDGLLMEITLVRNEVLSGAISTQAMENEPVATSVDSGEGPALEAVDLPENSIHCSSDGMGVQRAGCSSSAIPANDVSIGQESSTGECRNTEHVEADNIASPSMLLEGADSLVRGLNANNDDTVDTDQVHLESPILASSQSPIAIAGTQADLSSMSPEQSTDLSAQQNVAPSGHPPAEAERTGLSGTQVVQDLQPETQPSVLFSDAPLQNLHPDDRSQTGCQPDRATGLSQGGTATSYHSDEVRMQANAKNDGNVTADPVLSESPTYTAHSPATLPVSTELETQTCQSSMHVEQSVNVPAQQSLATCQSSIYQVCLLNKACDLQPEVQQSTSMQDQPAEGRACILGATAARGSQPEVQPSTSTQDQPAEAERAGTLGAISAQVLQPEMQSSTSTQGVPFVSGMPVLQSPSVHQSAGVELSGMVTPHAIQPPASMPAEQSTSLPVQQSLATLRHPPAEAEPASILATEAACNLQPEVRLSTSMQDQPAEEGACILDTTAAQGSQPEVQPPTSTQCAPFERTHLSGMPVLQSRTVHQSVEPSLDSHAGAESTDTLGVVTAPDLQSEIQPSASMHDRPAGAGAGMLGITAAQDLQPELQTSTTVQHAPLERTRSEERRQVGFEPNTATSPEHDRPAGAEGAGMLGSTAAQNLQPERQLSTTVQHIPLERIHSEERREIGPEQPTQLHPVPALVFHNPILSDEPLKNELEKIIHWTTLLDKGHEDKRSQLQIERNQEIEKINMKYDSLLQEEDSAHRLKRTELNVIFQKVYVSKSLAENFRRQFTPSVACQGRSTGHIMDQLPESSSAARGPASPPVIPSPAIRAPAHNSAGPYVRPSPVALSSSSRTVQSQSTMPGNLSGATSSPFVPAPSLHASYGPAGPQLRAVQPQSVSPSILVRTMSPSILTSRPQGSYGGPAGAAQLRAASPHLQHRMRPPYAIIHTDYQQQLPAIPGVPARGQFVPVLTESLRPTFPQAGAAVLASITPAGSAHQPMLPSVSGSSPATPAYFVPPGRHPDPVWTPNPALTLAQRHQQSSYPNMALGSSTSAGPAAPGSQQHAGGAQMPAVLNHPGLEPSSPPSNNPYMPARFGLEPGSSGGPSNAAGAGGPSTDVVCLSDDEA